MTLVQLRHLIALADGASFSRAAERLFITQPALSRSIQALEEELGQPLFDRIGRRSEPTAFGLALLERARHVVSDVDAMLESGRRGARALGGMLHIGLGSGPGALLTKPLLLRAAMSAGKKNALRIEIARGKTELLIQALRERTLDALVLDARSVPPEADLHIEALHEMPAAFMCRPGHPLTKLKGPLSFAKVARYPLASTPLSEEVARHLVERYGEEAHPSRSLSLRCEEIAALVETAQQSDAVLLAVKALGVGLVELPVKPALDAGARFGLVTLARRAQAPGLDIVRQLMKEVMA